MMDKLMAMAVCLTLASTSAYARECPWDMSQPLDVQATMTQVMVNGDAYTVAGGTGKMVFSNLLRTCKVSTETQMYFDSWRQKRTVVNVTGVAGIFIWPTLIATAVFATDAGANREAFVSSMRGKHPQRQ